jgi:hypothetical protein
MHVVLVGCFNQETGMEEQEQAKVQQKFISGCLNGGI